MNLHNIWRKRDLPLLSESLWEIKRLGPYSKKTVCRLNGGKIVIILIICTIYGGIKKSNFVAEPAESSDYFYIFRIFGADDLFIIAGVVADYIQGSIQGKLDALHNQVTIGL